MFGRATITLGIGPHSSSFSVTMICELICRNVSHLTLCGHYYIKLGTYGIITNLDMDTDFQLF